MDNRKSLEPGTVLELVSERNNTELVKIKEVIGKGANTFVYDAWIVDNLGIKRRRVLVKECYPLRCSMDRNNDNSINWINIESKKKALAYFKTMKEKNESIQCNDELMNLCTHVTSDIFIANDTQYIFIDKNNTITFKEKVEKNKRVSLFSIINNILALAKVVEAYHKYNYLILDIKPENFIIGYDVDNIVQIIDFDSIVHLDEIKENVKNNLIYTEQWAAPEVKMHLWSDIGVESDVYSVGAVLYYGITEKNPDIFDKMNGYDISKSHLLKGVNPKVIKELQQLISKMLSASIANRYSSMEKVCYELKKIKDKLDPNRIYLRGNMPKQSVKFVGRKKELNRIKSYFLKQDVVLINDIYGSGGMGKTELAKKFAIENKSEFKTIVFADCLNGIEFLIRQQRDLTIENYEFISGNSNCVSDFINAIKGLVDVDTLIILDDVTDFKDEFLVELLKCKCKFLITTRKKVENTFHGWSTVILNSMKLNELKRIFFTYCKRSISQKEEEALPELFAAFYNITTYIPAIGSLVNRGNGVRQLLNEVIGAGCLLENEDKITLCRNNLPTETSITELTEHLLRIGNYSEEILAIFSRIALLGHNMIYRSSLAEANKQSLIDDIISSGVVTYMTEFSLVGMNDVYGEYFRKIYGVRVAGGEEIIVRILQEKIHAKKIRDIIFSGRYEKENIFNILLCLDNEIVVNGMIKGLVFDIEKYNIILNILEDNNFERIKVLKIIIVCLVSMLGNAGIQYKYSDVDLLVSLYLKLSMNYCIEAEEYRINITDESYIDPIQDIQMSIEELPFGGHIFSLEKEMPKTYDVVIEVCKKLLNMRPTYNQVVVFNSLAKSIEHSELIELTNAFILQKEIETVNLQNMNKYMFIPNDLELDLCTEYPIKNESETTVRDWEDTYKMMLNDFNNIGGALRNLSFIMYKWFDENIYIREEICKFWSSLEYESEVIDAIKNIFFIRLCEEGIFGQVADTVRYKYKIVLIAEYAVINCEREINNQINELKDIINSESRIDIYYAIEGDNMEIMQLAKWLADRGNIDLALKVIDIECSDQNKDLFFEKSYIERLKFKCKLANALGKKKILIETLEKLNKEYGVAIISEEIFSNSEKKSLHTKQSSETENYDIDRMMNIDKFNCFYDNSDSRSFIEVMYDKKIKIKYEYSKSLDYYMLGEMVPF